MVIIMDSTNCEKADIVVVGGGPAGATLATFVALQGWKVILLERERFPRYQIGESLLPATVHGICVMLGVSEELKKANFTRKMGGTFRWGMNPKPWTFSFGLSPLMANSTSYAYQVERSKFDHLLLENAKNKGVDVREEHTVRDVIEENGCITGVTYLDHKGQSHAIRARYVVDASGNSSRIAERVGEKIYSEFFQNVALFGYFLNGKRLPPPNQGNILSAAFDNGWFWYIPLSPELTSVGVVLDKQYASKLKDGYEEAFTYFIDKCAIIKEYLSDAKRVTEGQYGQLRVRKDYSYCSTKFWSPGAVLVGDAACFIDPVFSSGVHLATYSALLAARSINTCLRGELDEQQCFEEFERRYRREFSNFYKFLVAFYDMHKDEESYFWTARKILNSEEEPNEAFIRLVGGVCSSGEPLYGSPEEFFNARKGISEVVQQAAGGVKTNGSTSDRNKYNSSAFMGELMHEVTQVQAQAQGKNFPQIPLFEDGLIPSADGFHWALPR